MVALLTIEPGFVCHVGDAGLLSIASVRSALGREFIALQDLRSLHAEVTQPHRKAGHERSLLAVLLLREAGRQRSPHMPYIMAFLKLPKQLASGWDPTTAAGASMREAANPRLKAAADVDRAQIARQHAALVPAAIDALPTVLGEGLADVASGSMREDLARFYSAQRFTETWLALRSRDFTNTVQEQRVEERRRGGGVAPRSTREEEEEEEAESFPAAFLAPQIDLMNHGGSESNVAVRYDLKRRGFSMTATRRIPKGQELRFSYGQRLCREMALLTYGFSDGDMPPCPSAATSGRDAQSRRSAGDRTP